MLPTRAAQQAALQALADHLAPGGLAVVDVWLPDAEDLARFDGRIMLEWPRLDPETGAIVTKVGSAQHDAAAATRDPDDDLRGGRPGRTRPALDPARPAAPRVGRRAARASPSDAGLVVELLAGGYDLGLLGPGSERAILIAVKP